VELHFLSADFAQRLRGKYVSRFLDPRTRDVRENVHNAFDAGSRPTVFPFLDAQGKVQATEFSIKRIGALAEPPPNTYLSRSPQSQAIFNDRTAPSAGTQFQVVPLREIRNHLVFVPCELGMPYSAAWSDHIAFYHVEPDPLVAGHMIAGLGRYILFEVLQPTPSVRVCLDYTAYYLANPEKQIPPAVVYGSERVPFAFRGRGPGRVISPPLQPLLIEGKRYVLLDLGCEPASYPVVKKGMMKWWGKDLGLDPRRLTGHGRGLSALSEADYEALAPPAMLQAFPGDLMHPDLEYSGVSEEGWVAAEAWLRLSAPVPNPLLVLEAEVPQLSPDSSFETELQVLIDGQVVARQLCKPGRITLRQAAAGLGRKSEVALRFSAVQRLPTGDDRPVAARLLKVGFASP